MNFFLSCKISPKEYTAGEKMLVRAIKEIALKIEILEKFKNLFKSFSSNCSHSKIIFHCY